MHEPARILIAEDEAIVAQDIEGRLRTMGHDPVAWVTAGEDAIRATEEQRPDIVLMDIRLRGLLDGIEAASDIRRRLDVPVIFLTAHADHATVERARVAQPMGYLLKPFQDKDLEVAISLALVRQAADRERRSHERWLATTLSSIGDAVVATSEEGVVRLMNPAAERLTGWRVREALGQPLASVVALRDEATQKVLSDPVQRALASPTGRGFSEQALLVARDGVEVPVREYLAPIRDEQERALGVVMALHDLSQERAHREELSKLLAELQRANSELLEQKSFLSALIESIPSAVLVVSPDRRVQSVNRSLEATFGEVAPLVEDLLPGEALRCSHAMAAPGTCGTLQGCSACVVRAAVDEALAGREVRRRRVELHGKGPDGPCAKVVLVTAVPLAHQRAGMALLIIEDITELNGLRALLGAPAQGYAGIVGRHPAMLEVFETVREVAAAPSPVLIQGESGTGKELVARAIHNESERASRAFVAVSCAALPEGLLETELFGHVKGAFTGAMRDKRGRFELADGGTIFLDEIGDLPASMQVKLLRVLQERCFERVGSERTVSVDVRVVSATNRDLRREIAAGKFREDLYYRLCVVPILVPPLRERTTDIPLIADHILGKLAAQSSRRKAHLTDDALAALMDYPWPGNIRELQNALEFALIKSHGAEIEPSHLPAALRNVSPGLWRRKGRGRKLTDEQVAGALEKTGGNRVQAARLLGVGRATLYRFLDGR